MRKLEKFMDTFHIGTYFLQRDARSEAHIRDMKDCGIDLVFGMENDRTALDLFEQYGVAAVVTGVVPGWFGGKGENAGTMRAANPKEAYLRGVEGFTEHPAVIGIDMGDEPSCLDFPYYGEVLRLMAERLPGKFLYLNIYPSYGMLADSDREQIEKELGARSYREYLQSYCEHVGLPYLSFDHYMYSSDRERFLRDLADAAACCRTYGKKLYVVLQVNSREKDVFLSEDQLRYQAFSALAFGVSAVSWACYSAGWWHNQVLDAAGNKTPQYEKLKNVNRELRGLTADWMKYRCEKTESLHPGETASFGVFTDITAEKGILLGGFIREDGAEAIFVSPLEEQTDGQNAVSFRVKTGRPVYLNKGCGKEKTVPDADGVFRIVLNGMEACRITLE